MKYKKIVEALFIDRPNRFIAYAKLNDEVVKCHVKNTGRCKELLIPNVTKVYLEDHGDNTNRKTRYSLVTVVKGNRIINMDSQAPNLIAHEWIESGKFRQDIIFIKREVKYHNSRFDIYYERKEKDNIIKGFVEVKGVTLEEDNIVRFPDAPTQRGIKHIEELIRAKKEGYEVNILFVIQMENVLYFEPNVKTHKEFGDALKIAKDNGVNIIAIDCMVTKDEVLPNKEISVKL